MIVPLPFFSTFQYTDYDYGGIYDYTDPLTTDPPPVEESKTEVTPD